MRPESLGRYLATRDLYRTWPGHVRDAQTFVITEWRWISDHANAHTTPNPTSMPLPDWVDVEQHRHALAERDQERQATAAPAWWCRARPARVKRGTSWLLVAPRAAPQR